MNSWQTYYPSGSRHYPRPCNMFFGWLLFFGKVMGFSKGSFAMADLTLRLLNQLLYVELALWSPSRDYDLISCILENSPQMSKWTACYLCFVSLVFLSLPFKQVEQSSLNWVCFKSHVISLVSTFSFDRNLFCFFLFHVSIIWLHSLNRTYLYNLILDRMKLLLYNRELFFGLDSSFSYETRVSCHQFQPFKLVLTWHDSFCICCVTVLSPRSGGGERGGGTSV